MPNIHPRFSASSSLLTLRMIVVLGLCVWTMFYAMPALWVACIVLLLSASLLIARMQSAPPSPRWNTLDAWCNVALALPMPLLTTGWRSPWLFDALLMFAVMMHQPQRKHRIGAMVGWLLFAVGLYAVAPVAPADRSLWLLLVFGVPCLLLFSRQNPVTLTQPLELPHVVPHLLSLHRRFEAIKHVLRNERETYEGTPAMEALHQAQHGLHETQTLLQELDPNASDVPSVVERLRDVTQQWQTRTMIPVALHVNLAGRLSTPLVEHVVIRAVEETLSNVQRHAKASRVDIELRGDDESLVLVVRDDGIGLKTGSIKREGLHGLRALNYRVQEINGSLDVFEGVDGGLVVQIALPLGVYAL